MEASAEGMGLGAAGSAVSGLGCALITTTRRQRTHSAWCSLALGVHGEGAGTRMAVCGWQYA